MSTVADLPSRVTREEGEGPLAPGSAVLLGRLRQGTSVLEGIEHKFTLSDHCEINSLRKVRRAAEHILHLIQTLPEIGDAINGFVGTLDTHVDHEILTSMVEHSRTISFNLARTVSSRKHIEPPRKTGSHSRVRLPKQGHIPLTTQELEVASFSCIKCRTTSTPQWRCGPAGPGTLCNLCGLVYKRRKRRRQLQLLRNDAP